MGRATRMTGHSPIQFGSTYDQRKIQQLERQVADQAVSIRRLERMLLGGTPGQVLTKTTVKDFEAEFADP